MGHFKIGSRFRILNYGFLFVIGFVIIATFLKFGNIDFEGKHFISQLDSTFLSFQKADILSMTTPQGGILTWTFQKILIATKLSKHNLNWVWFSICSVLFFINIYLVKLISGKLSGQSFFVTFFTTLMTLIYFPFVWKSLGGSEIPFGIFFLNLAFFFTFRFREQDTKLNYYLSFVPVLILPFIKWEFFIIAVIFIGSFKPLKVNKYSWIGLSITSLISITLNMKWGGITQTMQLSNFFPNLYQLLKLTYTHYYPFLIFALGNLTLREEEFTLKPTSEKVFSSIDYFRNVRLLITIFAISILVGLFQKDFHSFILMGAPALIIVSTLGLNQIRRVFGQVLNKKHSRRFASIIFFIVLWPPVCGVSFYNFFTSDSHFLESKDNIHLGLWVEKHTSKNVKVALLEPGALGWFSNRKWNDYNFHADKNRKKASHQLRKIANESDLIFHYSKLDEKMLGHVLVKGFIPAQSDILVKLKNQKEKIKPKFWKIEFPSGKNIKNSPRNPSNRNR